MVTQRKPEGPTFAVVLLTATSERVLLVGNTERQARVLVDSLSHGAAQCERFAMRPDGAR